MVNEHLCYHAPRHARILRGVLRAAVCTALSGFSVSRLVTWMSLNYLQFHSISENVTPVMRSGNDPHVNTTFCGPDGTKPRPQRLNFMDIQNAQLFLPTMSVKYLVMQVWACGPQINRASIQPPNPGTLSRLFPAEQSLGPPKYLYDHQVKGNYSQNVLAPAYNN